ncbi:MAG: MFS transporter, partial [Actinomyces sp.]
MGRGHAIDHRRTGALGLVAIGAYGSWYYAFGALLDAIAADTGWSEASLAGSYAAGTVLVGVGSVLGGRLLDRAGVRPVLVAGGVGGTVSLVVAAAAGDVVTFTVASALGMGLYGALGFYHVTMTTAVRVNPHAPASAIAVVSLWGALASAVYLPLTAALLEVVDWRMTVRILALSAGALFLLAALVVPERRRASVPAAATGPTAGVPTDPADPGDDPARTGGRGETGRRET